MMKKKMGTAETHIRCTSTVRSSTTVVGGEDMMQVAMLVVNATANGFTEKKTSLLTNYKIFEHRINQNQQKTSILASHHNLEHHGSSSPLQY